MIQSPMDLAEALRAATQRETAHQARATEPTRAAFVVPEQAVFIVHTVEGRAYRVTVTEEAL